MKKFHVCRIAYCEWLNFLTNNRHCDCFVFVESVSCEAPYYAVFSILLLFLFFEVEVFS